MAGRTNEASRASVTSRGPRLDPLGDEHSEWGYVMKHSDVTVVRIYLTEGERAMKSLLARLHDEEKVWGVTVFRGISGFGRSGVMHSTSLLDLSLDLPVVIEFFDEPAKVKRILGHLKDILPSGHVVSWSAQVNRN